MTGSIRRPDQIESLDAFQNLDDEFEWADYDPGFEWTEGDLAEFEHDRLVEEQIFGLSSSVSG